jgi:hypothetical protein
MPDVRQLLDERGARYGEFPDGAAISQALKSVMRDTPGWRRLTDAQREGLEMIQSKIARMLNGDTRYADNIDDVIGYATLVRQSMEAGNG